MACEMFAVKHHGNNNAKWPEQASYTADKGHLIEHKMRSPKIQNWIIDQSMPMNTSSPNTQNFFLKASLWLNNLVWKYIYIYAEPYSFCNQRAPDWLKPFSIENSIEILVFSKSEINSWVCKKLFYLTPRSPRCQNTRSFNAEYGVSNRQRRGRYMQRKTRQHGRMLQEEAAETRLGNWNRGLKWVSRKWYISKLYVAWSFAL